MLLATGINREGYREILGPMFDDSESGGHQVEVL
nr:hypothetical protein [Desulfofundulus thermosubterraneus]